ncbi:MAG: hypothetical protein FWF33_00600 [Clostridiales bacterium]|nr:hypothetical protein [Clostridiales bacterium]
MKNTRTEERIDDTAYRVDAQKPEFLNGEQGIYKDLQTENATPEEAEFAFEQIFSTLVMATRKAGVSFTILKAMAYEKLLDHYNREIHLHRQMQRWETPPAWITLDNFDSPEAKAAATAEERRRREETQRKLDAAYFSDGAGKITEGAGK